VNYSLFKTLGDAVEIFVQYLPMLDTSAISTIRYGDLYSTASGYYSEVQLFS